MKTNIDALKTDNHTITTLVILISILIVPLLFIGINEAWDYHMNYITEEAITDYALEYLETDSAVCLGTSSVGDHIVMWWDTGKPVDPIRVLNFKKVKDKYHLYDDEDSPIKNDQGIYTYYLTHNCIILITTSECKEISYIVDATKYKVSVETVPFIYSTGIPQELQFHMSDTAE